MQFMQYYDIIITTFKESDESIGWVYIDDISLTTQV